MTPSATLAVGPQVLRQRYATFKERRKLDNWPDVLMTGSGSNRSSRRRGQVFRTVSDGTICTMSGKTLALRFFWTWSGAQIALLSWAVWLPRKRQQRCCWQPTGGHVQRSIAATEVQRQHCVAVTACRLNVAEASAAAYA